MRKTKLFRLLLKKQLREVASFYVKDRKTGKRQKKGKLAGLIVLWLLVVFSLFMAGFGMCNLFGQVFFAVGLDWFYFILMGMVSLFAGIVGSVFNTYAGLYKAKDNDLLLSMPVSPPVILASRVFITFLLSAVFCSLLYVPTLAYYYVHQDQTLLSVLCSLLMGLVLNIISSALVCVLGYVIALIASKLKNKTYITVIISLAIMFGYYYVYFRMNKYLSYIAQNGELFAENIKGKAKLVMMFGKAFTGDVPALLLYAAFAIVLFALVYFILARNYLKIMTTEKGEKKTEYVAEKSITTKSVSAALFGKELTRFKKSAVYMLNAGLGALIIPILAVALLIKGNDIKAMLFSENVTMLVPNLPDLMPVMVLAAIAFLSTMVELTAPSVSLEGKSLWILKSLPVEPVRIFAAKKKLHITLAAPGMILFAVAACYVFEIEIITSMFLVLCAFVMVMFNAALGLMLNLLMPNLEWKDETVPVKQSGPALFMTFGMWGVVAGFGLLYYYVFAKHGISAQNFIQMTFYIFLFSGILIDRWVNTRGVKKWNEL